MVDKADCIKKKMMNDAHRLTWLGLAWLGLAWLGLAWLGLAWLGLALTFGLALLPALRGSPFKNQTSLQTT